MSFARPIKQSKPKVLESRTSISETPAQTQPSDLLRKRIAQLEDTVSKLQYSHDQFIPLINILESSPELLTLEDLVKGFNDRAVEIEQNIADQAKQSNELASSLSDIEIPPTLSEGLTTKGRGLSEMQHVIADLESQLHAKDMSQKVLVKSYEIKCKEQMVDLVEKVEGNTDKAKKEVDQLNSQLVGKLKDELSKVAARVDSHAEKAGNDKQIILKEIEDQSLGSMKDNWILIEMNERVDEAVKELENHVAQKYAQIELFCKQETENLKTLSSEISERITKLKSK